MFIFDGLDAVNMFLKKFTICQKLTQDTVGNFQRLISVNETEMIVNNFLN